MKRLFYIFAITTIVVGFALGCLIVAQLVIEDEIMLREGAKEFYRIEGE